MYTVTKRILPIVIALVFLFSAAQAQLFKVSYSAKAFNGPFSGKVVLYLSKDTKEPKDAGPGLPELACFAITVNNIKPGVDVIFDDKAIAYPVALSDIERGTYYVQAVWDRNTGAASSGRTISGSPGNMYSESKKVTLTKNIKQSFTVSCSEAVATEVFKPSTYVKELAVTSKLLTNFHKKNTNINGAVVLPKEYYEQPTRKFPVYIEVSGFGGSYFTNYQYSSNEDSTSRPIDTIPCIYVFLDGNCPLGHSVYANSDNNGPWGDALVKEFIPELESTYRCNGARLLFGHSSGGWTVLWLQTQYPKTFAGCWSSSPDPVDFRSFTGVDLYKDTNLFYDKDSALRKVATIAGYFPWIYMKDYFGVENVIYRGEQMQSFNAVFSKKGKDGKPEQICNTYTGVINPAVAADWRKYDISSLLIQNWNTVKTDLDGKVRISVGNGDNFLLNRAVRLLDKEMKKLDAKFEFVYVPGDHFTIATKEYFTNGRKFLANAYATWLAQQAVPVKE